MSASTHMPPLPVWHDSQRDNFHFAGRAEGCLNSRKLPGMGLHARLRLKNACRYIVLSKFWPLSFSKAPSTLNNVTGLCLKFCVNPLKSLKLDLLCVWGSAVGLYGEGCQPSENVAS